MHTFLFKLHNNLLGLNTRVANFVENHPRTCTFCDLRREPVEYPETTLHLFFECTSVEVNLQNFFSWISNDLVIGQRAFLTGFELANFHSNKILDLISAILKKIIWDCKLRFCIPTLEILQDGFKEEIFKLHCISPYVRNLIIKSELFQNHEDIHF